MDSQNNGGAEPTKLDVLHDAHDLLIHSVDAKTAGGNMVNQGTSIYVYTQSTKGKGKQRDVQHLALRSNLGGGEDHSQPSPRAIDRESPEWSQFMRAILSRCLNSFKGRNEVVDPSCTGSQDMGELPGFTLASFGDSDDPPVSKPRPSVSKGEAYVTSMLVSGKGLACWQPRPQAPIKDGEGVMPGDVGIFSVQEGFQKIFNIWDDEDSMRGTATSQGYEVPYNVPARIGNITRREYSEGDTVVQGTTSKTTYEPDGQNVIGFQFRHLEPYRKGGVLAITSTAVSEKLAASVQRSLYEHILQHAELIYRHAVASHGILDNEGLYIVTGCIKSESWALAGFSDPMTPPEDTLRLLRRRFDPNAASLGVPRYVWTEKGTADGYSGATEVKGSHDQCLFMKGYKLDFSQPFRERVRDATPADIGSSGPGQDGLGSSPPPPEDDHDNGEGPGPHGRGGHGHDSSMFGSRRGGGPSDGEFHLSMFPDVPNERLYHPCDALNMYILEKTGSDIAVSHDDDWIPVLKEARNTVGDYGVEVGVEGTITGESGQCIYSQFISTIRNISSLAPHEHVPEARGVGHGTTVSPPARPPNSHALPKSRLTLSSPYSPYSPNSKPSFKTAEGHPIFQLFSDPEDVSGFDSLGSPGLHSPARDFDHDLLDFDQGLDVSGNASSLMMGLEFPVRRVGGHYPTPPYDGEGAASGAASWEDCARRTKAVNVQSMGDRQSRGLQHRSVQPPPQARGPSSSLRSGRGIGAESWSAKYGGPSASSERMNPYPSPNVSPRVGAPDLDPDSGREVQYTTPDSRAPAGFENEVALSARIASNALVAAGHKEMKREASFVCPFPGCGSTFTRRFNLKGHIRSHNEEKPFVCHWPGCGKGFARQNGCKRHEELHTNYRPFTCEGCNRQFARTDALNRHLRSEGGAECAKLQAQGGSNAGSSEQHEHYTNDLPDNMFILADPLGPQSEEK